MRNIQFSIVLPTFNRAPIVSRAIQSVMDQTYTDWELIVIDDGSTDHTKEIVNQFNDERINYIYQENKERSAARNKGMDLAKGEWICFLDSDDAYKSNHLEQFAEYLANNNHFQGMLVSGIERVFPNKTLVHPPLDENVNVLTEILSKFILMNTVCVYHSILNNNRFDTRFRIWEDTHLWLRIAAVYPVRQLSANTCFQYIQSDGTVATGLAHVYLQDVDQYMAAISDLGNSYQSLFQDQLLPTVWQNYRDEKYKMYLYQARQNRQLKVSFQIWKRMMQNHFSIFQLLEPFKILLNKFRLFLNP